MLYDALFDCSIAYSSELHQVPNNDKKTTKILR